MPELLYSPLYNDSSLTHYYPLQGNSQDAKGSINGSDSNITYGTAYGKFRQGASFNGSNSVITFGSQQMSGNRLTLIAWCNFTTNPSNQISLFRNFDASGSDNYAGFALDINQFGQPLIMSGNNSGVQQGTNWQKAIGNAINDGKWHMVAGTYDGSNLRLYTDGKLITTVAWTLDPSFGAGGIQYKIGSNKWGNTDYYFTGDIDEVACFTRVLTLAEIQSLFNSGGGAALLGIL